jgi:hypothetical protein
MIKDQRGQKLARTTLALLQVVFATGAFIMIAAKIVPVFIVDAAAQVPPFSIGNFSSDVLILSLLVHLGLVLLFGRAFWLKAMGFAAQLAAFLVLASLTLHGIIALSAFAIHRSHLDFFDLFKMYLDAEEQVGGGSFITSILQQTLNVAVVLPTTLAVLHGMAALIDRWDLESAVVNSLKRRGRITPAGIALTAVFYVARCVNHIAHFVLPMTSQILREERFQVQIRQDLRNALKLMLSPNAGALVEFWKAINRIGRVVCGVLLLGIEYVPMWSAQVVTVLLGDENE